MALCWDAAAVGCGIDVVVFFVRARVFRDLFSLLGEKRFSEAVGALETGIILMGNKNYSFQAYILFLIGINITFCVCTIFFVRAHSFV
jgi:hypothetical protein